MLQSGDRVIAAVSGGADSVFLLHILVDLSHNYGMELLAAHFNHQLRGAESDGDQQFVEDLCGNLGVQLRTGSAPVREIAGIRKGSIEEICRTSRYEFLLSIMRESGFGKIALGHNLDDQAETVLMNVIRGTGIDGLKGIDPVRDCYIRPLLEITRAEIEEFLKERNIPFRTDSSNLDNSFRRNSIRNSLIPEIRDKYNPAVTAALGRLAGIARMENSFLEKAAREALGLLRPGIKLEEFRLYHPAVQSRIIKMALEELSPVQGGISHEHIAAVLDIVNGGDPGASISLPYRITARREYECLRIERMEAAERRTPDYSYKVNVPGILRVKEAGMEFMFTIIDKLPDRTPGEWRACMDYRMVVPPLVFRNVRPGDRIRPFGMKSGQKKLQDVFTDRKVPRARRRSTPVLADAESVLWVPGVVRSERMRVSGMASDVLSVEKI